MNIKEIDFRYYHMRFFYVEDNETLRNKIKEENKEKYTGYLSMIYINHDKGVKLEILSFADNDNNFSDPFNERYIFDYDDISNINIKPYLYEDIDEDRFKVKIKYIIDENTVDYKIKETREYDNLDQMRKSDNPDEVLVYLMDNKNQPEALYVRLKEIDGNKVVGRLTKNPIQDFGVKKDQKIYFRIGVNGGKRICVAML